MGKFIRCFQCIQIGLAGNPSHVWLGLPKISLKVHINPVDKDCQRSSHLVTAKQQLSACVTHQQVQGLKGGRGEKRGDKREKWQNGRKKKNGVRDVSIEKERR